MVDREKVIQKLEECLSASCCGFRTCPYNDDGWDAVREALTLLKEQEPVKPRPISYGIYKCGNCGHYLERIIEVDRYCNQCGRKVLWDG